MTNKERVYAALEGKPVDRCPVTSLYNHLYQDDHFSELTQLPAWRWHEWVAMSSARHLELFKRMHEAAPFELLQPHEAPALIWRQRQEFVEKDGHPYRHDCETDEWVQLDLATKSGHACDYHANETRHIFSQYDIEPRIPINKWEDAVRDGANDYLDAIIREFGNNEFILSGGVIGTLYYCGWQVGQTNLFTMLIEEPELVESICARITERNIAEIRRLAAAGGDAIFIDDATATSDMISCAMYERYSQPYMTSMVEEIHRLGHKAILIYFGGVMDRLEQIAATDADGLLYEASMKNYVNDTAEIARRIGDRITLFSNIDPVSILQDGTDMDVEAEIDRQIEAGRSARGFIISTASPITPYTPLTRVQRFLELGRSK